VSHRVSTSLLAALVVGACMTLRLAFRSTRPLTLVSFHRLRQPALLLDRPPTPLPVHLGHLLHHLVAAVAAAAASPPSPLALIQSPQPLRIIRVGVASALSLGRFALPPRLFLYTRTHNAQPRTTNRRVVHVESVSALVRRAAKYTLAASVLGTASGELL